MYSPAPNELDSTPENPEHVDDLLELAWSLCHSERDRALEIVTAVESRGPHGERIAAIITTVRALHEVLAETTASNVPIPAIEHLANDTQWHARAVYASARLHLSNNEYADAIAKSEQCHALFESIDDRSGVAAALATNGYTRVWSNDFGAGVEHLERSLDIRTELDDRWAIASTLRNLATAHFLMNDWPTAHDYAQRSLALAEELDDRAGVASALQMITNVECNTGDFANALVHGRQCVDITTELDTPKLTAIALNTIGLIHSELGDNSESLSAFEKCHDIARDNGYRGLEATALSNIGNLHHLHGQYAAAREAFESAVEVMMERGLRATAANTLNSIGTTYFETAQYEQALDYHRRSLEMALDINSPQCIAGAKHSVAMDYCALGRVNEALPFLDEALRIDEEIGDSVEMAHVLRSIGTTHHRRGDVAAANDALQRSLALSQQLGHKQGQMKCLELLAQLQRDASQHADAYASLVEHHRLKSEIMTEDVQRKLHTADAARKLELANHQAEIERLRNVELADALRELEDAHRELKSAQSQLVHAEKMSSLGQLTAGIAHEINNPINYIRTSVEPLRRDLDEIRAAFASVIDELPDDLRTRALVSLQHFEVDDLRDEIDALLRSIHDGATRTSDIVLRLRTFSRLDEDDRKRVDLHAGIDSTLSLLDVRTASDVSVVRDYGSLPLVECAPGQINQVFMNVMSNAIDAVCSRDGGGGESKGDGAGSGEITVRTSCTDSHVCIAITDNGHGIEEANLSRIFDPFFTTKPVGAGQGLGLSIAHGIVERHGGTIEVRSEVGQGSTFTITLPVG